MDLHIKDVLKNMVTSESKISEGYFGSKMETYWMTNMPKSISDRTSKISLRNGIVYLTITSAALKNELFNSKQKIVSLLNDYLNEEIVKDVKFL